MIPTAAIILAGGLARRMGGLDKCRLVVGGRTILARTIDCLTSQADPVAINANGDLARFADTALPLLPDPFSGHPGPLAGVLAGLDWAASLRLDWLLSVPGDCPFLPPDLVARLHAARGAATYAVAASAGWTHPVIALWPTACRDALRHSLRAGQRKIDAFTAQSSVAVAEWATDPADPFANVNTPDNLHHARCVEAQVSSPLHPPPSDTELPAGHNPRPSSLTNFS